MTTTTDTIIARRSTYDGKHVCLWSDGSLTWGGIGTVIKGCANPRTPAQVEQALRAGWLVVGEVCIHNADEVTALISAARWTAQRDGNPGDMRSRLAAVAAPKMPGGWTILATDRDGNATERSWRFPRLCPMRDLAIWHARGRYHVLVRVMGSEDTFAPTGFVCASLAEAFRAVRTIAGEAG